MIEQGRQHLQSYLGELLDAIGRSAPACPPVIRAVFQQLFRRVGERFPQHQVGLRQGMDRGSNGDVPRRQGCNPQLWGPLLGMVTAPQGWVQGDSRATLHPSSIPGAETSPPSHQCTRGVLRWDRPSHVSPRLCRLQHTKFVAITSFLCLRFFSPAIMTPKLFHLRETHADARTSRTLLLLAKVGWGGAGREVVSPTLGFLGCFPLGRAGDTTVLGGLQAIQLVGNMEPAAGRAKETWLAPLLPALQQGIALMKDFIARLVGTEREEEGGGQPPGPPAAVVKEGPLFVHKTRGKGPLLATAAKKLHFCLSGDTLSFGKSPGTEVGGRSGAVGVAARWH